MRLGRNSFRLFGLDLVDGYDYFREGWREARGWPVLAWLSPQEPVTLVGPDGGRSVRWGLTAKPLGDRAQARAVAVELDEDAVLIRQLKLPRLTQRQLEAALLLQARTLSPFSEGDLVWGWRRDAIGEVLTVTLVMASREAVLRHIETLRLAAEIRPEVWFDGNRPVLVRGFGEGTRARREGRTRVLLLVATAILPLCLLVAAAAPVYRATKLSADAEAKLAALQKEAAPSIRLREQLVKLTGSASALAKHLADPGRELVVLDLLTRVIPDDAMVSRAEFSGTVVRLTGIAEDGTRVLQLLTNRPEFSSVRALAPFSRISGGRESFSIEVTLHDGDPPK